MVHHSLTTKLWSEQIALAHAAEISASPLVVFDYGNTFDLSHLRPGQWLINLYGYNAKKILAALKLRVTRKRLIAVCEQLQEIDEFDPDY